MSDDSDYDPRDDSDTEADDPMTEEPINQFTDESSPQKQPKYCFSQSVVATVVNMPVMFLPKSDCYI